MTRLSLRETVLLSVVPVVFTVLTSCCGDWEPEVQAFQVPLSAECLDRLGATRGEAILTSSHLLIEIERGGRNSSAILGFRAN